MKKILKALKAKISGWKTAKAMLFLAVLMVIAYCTVTFILNLKGVEVDSTNTAEWYSFWKWTVTTGAGITGIKLIKNKKKDEEE